MHNIDPSQYILYIVYPQLDSFASEGVQRSLSGFATIAQDADDYADKMFESYRGIGDDPSAFAEEARDQGIAHFTMLAELRQGIVNLLAVSLYHLFEQHRAHAKRLVTERGGAFTEPTTTATLAKIKELRLIANTAKHADGGSAQQLRSLRPDLFVPRVLRGSALAKHITATTVTVTNPLGGTDFFLAEGELEVFRDAIRAYWEEAHSLL